VGAVAADGEVAGWRASAGAAAQAASSAGLEGPAAMVSDPIQKRSVSTSSRTSKSGAEPHRLRVPMRCENGGQGGGHGGLGSGLGSLILRISLNQLTGIGKGQMISPCS